LSAARRHDISAAEQRCAPRFGGERRYGTGGAAATGDRDMKVRNSLKSLKARHKDCRLVRRKGRVYVINKTQPRFKARQG